MNLRVKRWGQNSVRIQGAFWLFIQRYGSAFAIVAIALVATVVLVWRAMLIPLHVSLNYNEGWNAFQSARAFSAEPLYPSSDALIGNNYPPLSFYIVGGLGQLLGDNIVAGRVISMLSLLSIAIAIGWIVAGRSRQFVAGLLAGLLFLATFSLRFMGYVAINDPQLLAHALQIVALAGLLRGRLHGRAVVGLSMLMAASLLVKHNLIALPVTMAVWLFCYKRRAAYTFVAVTVGMILLSFLLFYTVYGADFLLGLFKAPRTYSFSVGLSKMSDWLAPLRGLMVLGVLTVVLRWRDRDVQCIGAFGVLALLFGTAIAGGTGVNFNAVFDVAIALCLLSGLAIAAFDTERIRQLRSRYPASLNAPQLVIALFLVLTVMMLGFQFKTSVRGLIETVAARPQLATESAETIQRVASYDDPVVCEQAALCYWAGKAWRFDLFSVEQKLATGAMSEADVLRRIKNREFSLFVLDTHPYDNRPLRSLGRPISKAIRMYYEKFYAEVTATKLIPANELWRPRSLESSR